MSSWIYRLTFNSPVSVFSGLAVAGLVDRMVVRDVGKLPVIPGSTVKGRWRLAAEQLLTSLNGNVGQISISSHPSDKPACKRSESPCTLCRWFGSPAIQASMMVGPATLEKKWLDIFCDLHRVSPGAIVSPDTEIRPGIALSRQLRTTLPDHLFFDEAVPAVSFTGKILLTSLPTPQEEAFLVGAARLVTHIGARKAAGRGMLETGIEIIPGGVE